MALFAFPYAIALKNLSGIHDTQWIYCLLNRAHRRNGRRAKLWLQEALFALPDTMLAGAGPLHGKPPLGQPVDERFRAFHLVRVFHHNQRRDMEIAVADMPYNRCNKV